VGRRSGANRHHQCPRPWTTIGTWSAGTLRDWLSTAEHVLGFVAMPVWQCQAPIPSQVVCRAIVRCASVSTLHPRPPRIVTRQLIWVHVTACARRNVRQTSFQSGLCLLVCYPSVETGVDEAHAAISEQAKSKRHGAGAVP